MSAEAVTQLAIRTVEVVQESPFYIPMTGPGPMTGPAARPRRSLKHDDTFIVLDSHGDIGVQNDMLHIVRTIFLWRGTAYQRIGVQNHGDRAASFRAEVTTT
jgi:hypothetical protein